MALVLKTVIIRIILGKKILNLEQEIMFQRMISGYRYFIYCLIYFIQWALRFHIIFFLQFICNFLLHCNAGSF